MNPAMTWEKFWSIIDRVRAKADVQDEASVNQFLYTELINLPQDELLGFDCVWQSYRNKANFPKMVAAACIINDGSSDDRFTDFRNWLIMQGYDAYRQAMIDPDNLAALNIPFRDTEWMGCGNVAWYAYAGQKLRIYFEKAGVTAELHRKYPTLLKSSADLHQAIMQEQLAPCRAPETEWERQMLRTEVKHYIDTSGLAYSYNEFYSQKGKVSNLKEMNETFNYLRANGIYSLEDLEHRVSEHSAATESLKKTLDEQTARMKAIKQLYDSSAAFQSLKPVYDGLQKIKFEKPRAKYKAEHETELKQFYAARRKLTGEFPDGKVDMKKLSDEYDELEQAHNTTYGEFKTVRDDLHRLWKVKSCVDTAARFNERTEEQKLQNRPQTRQKKEDMTR